MELINDAGTVFVVLKGCGQAWGKRLGGGMREEKGGEKGRFQPNQGKTTYPPIYVGR